MDPSDRGWTQESYIKFRSNSRGRYGRLHCAPQKLGGGPIAMTIKQGADDAPVQNAFERVKEFRWSPVCDHFIPPDETPDVQTLRIGWTTAEADASGSVGLLKALVHY